MLRRVVEWAVGNKLIVLLFTFAVIVGGFFAVKRTTLEALPDLSDVQVIIQADYNEQAPRIVEDQVTFPIAAVGSVLDKRNSNSSLGLHTR